jgi:O-antigen ligase
MLRLLQFWITITVLVMAPLFFGSVGLLWVAIWTVALSVGVVCGLGFPMEPAQTRILLAFCAALGLYGAVSVLQVAPDVIPGLSDGIWRKSSDLLSTDLRPRISSRAQIPPIAIGHGLLFAVSFISGFCVCTSRKGADNLFRFTRLSILAYAIYGVLAFLLAPNYLLWSEKTAYLGLLTGTFVNHNTAATFFGAGGILWCCSAYFAAREIRVSSARTFLLSRSNERMIVKLIARGAGALVCMVALLQTASRGGIICSFAGLFVAIMLLLLKERAAKFWTMSLISSGAVVVIAAVLSRTGRIGSQGLLDQGRWSVYARVLDAIKQRPLLGFGLGTFSDQFPSLRSSDLPSWGIWDYAHSTMLEIAFEMGAPIAVVILVAAVLSILILASAALTSNGHDRLLASAVSGIAVLTYSHALIDFSLQIPGYSIVFAILLGGGLARACSRDSLPSMIRPQHRHVSNRIEPA